MAMTKWQLALVRAIAESNFPKAKQCAINCCIEDTSKKNEYEVKRYRNILENNPTMLEVPYNLKSIISLEDVSTSFDEDRYYLSSREKELFDYIVKMNSASLRLMEMKIPYLNAVLLTGVSGTGKTTFGRYVAYKLGLPFLYINFTYLIDSHMGKTGQNLRQVFEFARMNKCILMLDEIDSIAQERKGGSEGASKEFNNTTIALLEELDKVQNDSIIIAATNVLNSIDKAVKRRFSVHHEVLPLTKEEAEKMIEQYLSTIGMEFDKEEISAAVEVLAKSADCIAQSEVLKFMITKIVDAISDEKNTIYLM